MRSNHFVGWFLMFLLAACGTSNSSLTSPEISATASPAVIVSTATNIQNALVSTQTVGANFTSTHEGDAPLPTWTTQPVFQACSPLEGHSWTDLREIVTNPFDPPPPGKDSGHHGVDFAYYRRNERLSIEGVPVEAVLSGKIAAVVHNRPPYGNMVIIETPMARLTAALANLLEMTSGESVYLLYAHMKAEPLVELNQPVVCSEKLGEVGNTPPGWSSAPHLHLELRIGPSGAEFSTMAYYDNSITPEEKSNYELWRTSGTFRMLDPLRLLEYALK